MGRRVLGLAAAVLAFGLSVGSASANSVPVFYLVPSGPTTVPTVVPVGTTTYQLWIDPSGVYAPALYAPSCVAPINGGCTGIYGVINFGILGSGSLTLTAFTPNTSSPVSTSGSLYHICVGFGCLAPPSYLDQAPTAIEVSSTGEDQANPFNPIGISTPFEVGSLSITNSGSSGIGDITLAGQAPPFGGSPEYTDANFDSFPVPVPQTLAVAAPVPEPGTLLLLGTGLASLAVAVRARRPSLA